MQTAIRRSKGTVDDEFQLGVCSLPLITCFVVMLVIYLSTFLGKAQCLSQGRIILRTYAAAKQHFNDCSPFYSPHFVSESKWYAVQSLFIVLAISLKG